MRKLLYIIPLFMLAFTFTGGPPSGWYQQTLPDIGNRPIADMLFTDSLTGYLVTPYGTINDSNYILKTTNGGDNWNIILRQPGSSGGFERMIFLNDNIGYAVGNFMIKTTNAGMNWFSINMPHIAEDAYILNEDTIWIVESNSVDGGIFRTTNGGANWTVQLSVGAGNPNKIYMINKDSGYAADGTRFRRTTNSGVNWTLIAGQDGFQDMHFVDNSTGWKANGNIKKTTDGGDTWVQQNVPSGGNVSLSDIIQLSVLNKDTVWGVGGIYRFQSGNSRGIVWRTTNGGINWGFQIPDSSIQINKYYHISLANKNNIWAYAFALRGIHTITGGNDTTFFTGIEQTSNEVPQEFKLFQNYPNPFNPSTSIKFNIQSSNTVKLTIFDITGKEVAILVNEKLSAGEYEYQFNGSNIPSGVYFYKLQTGGFIDTKKMMMVK